MPKSSVLGSPSPVKGGAPKNGFPMSQNFTFTAGAGMFLPVYKQVLNYGESVKGLPKAFVRTEPLLAPAMADLDLYVDVFFVPMTHIIGMFDDWIVQVDDAKSSMWSPATWQNSLPVVGKKHNDVMNGFGWMTEAIFNAKQFVRPAYYGSYDNVVNFGFGCHRLTQHLGYNAQALFCKGATLGDNTNVLPQFRSIAADITQPAFCPYYFAAYQKIYYDYYRDSQKEGNNVKAYNLDDEMNAGNLSFYPTDRNDPRLGMFALRYRYRAHDYFTHTYVNPFFNSIGMLPNATANLMRVNQWLDSERPVKFFDGTKFTGLGLLAAEGDITAGGRDVETDLANDYYDINGDDLPNSALYHKDASIGVYEDGEFISAFHTHNLDTDDIAGDLQYEGQPISLQQVRTAFALDKLMRLSSRAGKHADDQILAQFGVKIPKGISGEVYHIKGYHTIFHIGEVVQSATTVDSNGNDIPLGELAGRGVALLNGNDSFTFTAPTAGVLMAIMSISPRYKYAFTIEKDGMKTYIEDFFKPAQDHLGMQPMFDYEAPGRSATNHMWQYRYMEDKIKFDKATMVFATNSKNPWTFVQPFFGEGGAVTKWPAVSGDVGIAQSDYFVLPNDTNNMFVVQYLSAPLFPDGDDDKPEDTLNIVNFLKHYLRDPFTVDFNMTCTKVSQMSTYGEPTLGGI